LVQRGHDRAPCFFTDAERELYLGLLSTFSRRLDCHVHGYVLMTNHVHLLLTPGDARAPSQLMKDVGQRFAQYMNKKYSRVGSLWQGRFHSSLVDTDAYFLACQRYIEANPVRAGMVPAPNLYPWSSYASHALGTPSPILTPHATYLALGLDDATRRAAYRRICAPIMDATVVEAIRSAIRHSLPFGSDEFVERMEARTGRRLRNRPPGPAPKREAGTVTGDLFNR
jgi:putative transposase